jgi:hypothetical protein
MTQDHIIATVASDTIVAFDVNVEFVILLAALLTSSPVMRCGVLWKFGVLLSNLAQCESCSYEQQQNEV